MTDSPRRPTLHLKFPPAQAPGGPAPTPRQTFAPSSFTPSNFASRKFASAAFKRPAVKTPGWKCKPCGTSFQVSGDLADEDAVRCPSCNARLGRAGDFLGEPPALDRVRARLATVKG